MRTDPSAVDGCETKFMDYHSIEDALLLLLKFDDNYRRVSAYELQRRECGLVRPFRNQRPD